MVSSTRNTYLPLNEDGFKPNVGPNLLSWAAKHKGLVMFVFLACFASVQLYFFSPYLLETDAGKKLKSQDWIWPAHKSPNLPPADGSKKTDFPLQSDVGPHSFPSALDPSIWGVTHKSLHELYPQGDPHRGEIPADLLQILEVTPQANRPPWPEKAPEITEEMWYHNPWKAETHASKTTFKDAYQAHLQKGEEDWREYPYDGWKPPLEELADQTPLKPLPKVQYNFQDSSKHSGRSNDPKRDELIKRRQRLVKNAFLHAWEGYKKFAWGHDELRPVTKRPQDNFNGWGATIVDALDTLLVMGLPAEYDLARQHVRDVDFRLVGGDRSAYGAADGRIPVFETAIRYLGGFLSAYDLSGDVLMRDRAEELAQLIMPAFDTATGVPVGRIDLMSKEKRPFAPPRSQGSSVLAEAGSLLVEFTRLWQVTGNRTYFDKVQRNTDWFDKNMTQAPGRAGDLFPTTIFPESKSAYGAYSFGGMADSYYEYLIKGYQLLGGKFSQYARMYSKSIDSAQVFLMRNVTTVPGAKLVTIGEFNGGRFTPKLEHLACFSGGMLGLGSRLLSERKEDITFGQHFAESCWWAYNSTLTGIGPESLIFYNPDDHDRFESIDMPDGTQRRGKARGNPIVGVRSAFTSYLNRPETIESVLYMWRITGDEKWQERGWQMFSSWVTHCMTDIGFSSISNVNQVPAQKTDSQESFTFAETFKYYYLLFSPPELVSLDEYIFTTEAHPLLAPKNGRWAEAGKGSMKFWDPTGSEDEIGASSSQTSPIQDPHVPPQGSELYSGGERKRVGGLSNNQKHLLYNRWQQKHAVTLAKRLLENFGAENIKSRLRSFKLLSYGDEGNEYSASSSSSSPSHATSPTENSDTTEVDGGVIESLDDGSRLILGIEDDASVAIRDALKQLGIRTGQDIQVLTEHGQRELLREKLELEERLLAEANGQVYQPLTHHDDLDLETGTDGEVGELYGDQGEFYGEEEDELDTQSMERMEREEEEVVEDEKEKEKERRREIARMNMARFRGKGVI
ncbi:seven-hairpin glycosidase [Violaceomyces palustris]|uniref:Seven-hairpin glycosidase n=1 Tax=Violaceomyces palustris TaxID=1673888 RepID=A0ACD0NZG4_9BASI|nr:seven-hairpin glycosidase [Violaceomyces palustris]